MMRERETTRQDHGPDFIHTAVHLSRIPLCMCPTSWSMFQVQSYSGDAGVALTNTGPVSLRERQKTDRSLSSLGQRCVQGTIFHRRYPRKEASGLMHTADLRSTIKYFSVVVSNRDSLTVDILAEISESQRMGLGKV
ncbi:hypothetical protein EYF80_032637 [Liparis tanakae]|uniref:Uncharacterized protein n=1 Tax=Liparis tanakae TaxID=230148 RepID=A0A4Z2GX15_9TELE|nr:hypothetical protein EYF80_032637 [Liparis tanakae]